jgi:hypothetical protein
MAYVAPPLLNLRDEVDQVVEQAVARRDVGFAELGSAAAPDAFDLSSDIMDRAL